MFLRSLLLSFCILSFGTFLGQTTSPSPLKFNGGFVGGATLSQVHGDDAGGFDKLAFNAGAVVEINRINKTLQLGIVYNKKGSRQAPTPQSSYNWELKLDYIDLPIMFLYNYSGHDVIFGLQPSYLLSVKRLENNLPSIHDEYNDWDLSWAIGLRTPYGEKSKIYARLTQSIFSIEPKPDDAVQGFRYRLLNMTLELGTVILIR